MPTLEMESDYLSHEKLVNEEHMFHSVFVILNANLFI